AAGRVPRRPRRCRPRERHTTRSCSRTIAEDRALAPCRTIETRTAWPATSVNDTRQGLRPGCWRESSQRQVIPLRLRWRGGQRHALEAPGEGFDPLRRTARGYLCLVSLLKLIGGDGPEVRHDRMQLRRRLAFRDPRQRFRNG